MDSYGEAPVVGGAGGDGGDAGTGTGGLGGTGYTGGNGGNGTGGNGGNPGEGAIGRGGGLNNSATGNFSVNPQLGAPKKSKQAKATDLISLTTPTGAQPAAQGTGGIADAGSRRPWQPYRAQRLDYTPDKPGTVRLLAQHGDRWGRRLYHWRIGHACQYDDQRQQCLHV